MIISDKKQILLLSNSATYGGAYFDYAQSELSRVLKNVKQVLFVPFAVFDRDEYGRRTGERFAAMGYKLVSLHQMNTMLKGIQEADAIFIGGGNTFRLLKTLYEYDLLHAIRERVEAGIPYIGSSAGSNVACPTIKTTNDMPIVQPPSLEALGLVPFQVNPHYQDPDPNSTHMGETRPDRIREFHEENSTPVVGLREATMLTIEEGSIVLNGIGPARIFRKGREPVEAQPGSALQDLLFS
jgi:dipeptidase E